MKLINKQFREDGVFGVLQTDDGEELGVTLTHSYNGMSKTANGTYTCKRGKHRLHGMTEDFETFEITNVPDFDGKPVTGILFHWGNFNRDSEGCFLLGDAVVTSPKGVQAVADSRLTFKKFMDKMVGIDEFDLVISSAP